MHHQQQLLRELSEPDEGVIKTMSGLQGDLLLLGAGGKIGHALALMAQRALEGCGSKHRAVAVSRFSSAAARQQFEKDHIATIACDLTDLEAVANLPDAAEVVYLAGQKFGTADAPATTWLMNTVVPGVVARRWPKARIAAYSSGNVFPFTPIEQGGCMESDPTGPIGEYAQSVLGRERIFEYYSRIQHTKVTLIRLTYAVEPRYGVLVDIGNWILAGQPVSLTMGYVNMVWQGDCNRITLRSLDLAHSPARILNLTGPWILSVKDLALGLGKVLGVEPKFAGQPAKDAMLVNSDYCWKHFGPPSMDVEQMIQRVGAWLKAGHPTMNKPTHFEVRNGSF